MYRLCCSHQWSLFAAAPIIFSNIKTVVLSVTSSCFQPHYANKPFFFFFQSQLIPVCCISVFSPSFVCLAWQHGNCFICDDSSLPRNSLSSLKKVVANVLILWDTVSTGLHVFQEVSLFLHLNLWWTKAAIPNTCSY